MAWRSGRVAGRAGGQAPGTLEPAQPACSANANASLRQGQSRVQKRGLR